VSGCGLKWFNSLPAYLPSRILAGNVKERAGKALLNFNNGKGENPKGL
jgi:hypothetical protein